MNISSAVDKTAMFGQVSTTNANNKISSPINESEQALAYKKTLAQEQSQHKQTASSIVFDEQAVTRFKENQPLSSTTRQLNNPFSLASEDQPSAKNETAVAHYQAINNLSERESVQKMFGVDLLA